MAGRVRSCSRSRSRPRSRPCCDLTPPPIRPETLTAPGRRGPVASAHQALHAAGTAPEGGCPSTAGESGHRSTDVDVTGYAPRPRLSALSASRTPGAVLSRITACRNRHLDALNRQSRRTRVALFVASHCSSRIVSVVTMATGSPRYIPGLSNVQPLAVSRMESKSVCPSTLIALTTRPVSSTTTSTTKGSLKCVSVCPPKSNGGQRMPDEAVTPGPGFIGSSRSGRPGGGWEAEERSSTPDPSVLASSSTGAGLAGGDPTCGVASWTCGAASWACRMHATVTAITPSNKQASGACILKTSEVPRRALPGPSARQREARLKVLAGILPVLHSGLELGRI